MALLEISKIQIMMAPKEKSGDHQSSQGSIHSFHKQISGAVDQHTDFAVYRNMLLAWTKRPYVVITERQKPQFCSMKKNLKKPVPVLLWTQSTTIATIQTLQIISVDCSLSRFVENSKQHELKALDYRKLKGRLCCIDMTCLMF